MNFRHPFRGAWRRPTLAIATGFTLAASGFAAPAEPEGSRSPSSIANASATAAAAIQPDPDLFDGSKYKKPDQIEQQKQQTVDDWEDANLIIYDSNEQGSEQGGQGLAGYQNPGYDQGSANGTQGAGMPMPGGGPGGQSDKQAIASGGQPGGPSTPTQGNNASAKGDPGNPGMAKPGDVPIGDDGQRIATVAQPNQMAAPDATAESQAEQSRAKGEDTTQMPKAAAGVQSGRRGGGVEKGEAMPSDL